MDNERKLSKYMSGESVELLRSEINLADYNPRVIDDESRKNLKRGIKKYGLVGGIFVNKRTGNTLVSGHQRISVMDELQHYDPNDPNTDYKVRVDLIDVDEANEKELNILTNNLSAQGRWDYEKLRELLPDINYKDAGLSEADLSMIGVDYLYKTEEENNLASELEAMMADVNAEHKAEVEARAEERRKTKEEMEDTEKTAEERKQHMIDVKQGVRDKAINDAETADAYVILSFDDYDAKMEFLKKFGYDPFSRFIKGEDFDSRLEGDYEEE